MKLIFSIVLSLANFASISFAASSPSLTANLKEVASNGVEINAEIAKTLELREDSLFLVENGITTEFRVIARSFTGCGSTRYTGYLKPTDNNPDYYRNLSYLVLTDHISKSCKRAVPARWEMTWYSLREAPRYFNGNPGEVIDTVACLEQVRQLMCPMIYAPVKCSVTTIDGGTIPISPISVDGGNTCEANLAIREAACVAGIDPARILTDDVGCESTRY